MRKLAVFLIVLFILIPTPLAAEEDILYANLRLSQGQKIPLHLNNATSYIVTSVTGGENIIAVIYNNGEPVVVINKGMLAYGKIFQPEDCFITLSSDGSVAFDINIQLMPYTEGLMLLPSSLNMKVGDSVQMSALLKGKPVDVEYIVPSIVSNDNGKITALLEGEGFIQAIYYSWEGNTLVSHASHIPIIITK